MSYGVTPSIPSLRMNDYNHSQVVEYLSQRHAQNKNLGFGVCQYAHGLGTLPSQYAYYGGVLSPISNRIYLIPYAQGVVSTWHYIDCVTGAVVPYSHGLGTMPVTNAYRGGVYSPTQNRIYFIPYVQAEQATWHYIDCNTGAVVAYTHGLGTLPLANAYLGGVYSPAQNRIYMVPHLQSDQTYWHYIDCNNGSVVPYAHGATTISTAYGGGVYSPLQNRIYLVPYLASNQSTWHYIDCNTGAVTAYANGLGTLPVSAGYCGGAFSPIQNRIYFSPYQQSNQTNWHYLDCTTGSVVAYPHGLGTPPLAGGYLFMAYSPSSNRIYLSLQVQGDQPKWHYINCNDGKVVEYTHGVSSLQASYRGAIYSPANNKIYFIPYAQANQASWHYIQEYSTADVSPTLMSSTLFNKI